VRYGALAYAVIILAFGCAPRPNGLADECQSVTYGLQAGSSVDQLVGSFAVRMVATSGDSAGRVVAGQLTLVRSDRSDAPVIGAADLAVEVVGALRLGDLAANNETAPGVLVLREGNERPTILLRLGSEANAEGVVRFDGGYTVLDVQRLDAQGFQGSWRSGITANVASGHFCAYRSE
jgi:hypothetical protein